MNNSNNGNGNNGQYVNPFTPVNRGGRNGPLDQYTNRPSPGGQDDSPFYKGAAPSINLPKGGGALKGIDEKFSVNAVNGTASLDIPFPLTPGRGGFTPALALAYNSGGGNSEFGLGWSLSLPAIQRKTDKKLPQYYDGKESDIFLLAGAEDLVPELDNSNNPVIISSGIYTIKRYRPRIEGLFARIEYIRKSGSAESWWRVITKDNIATWYGLNETGRIADPQSAGRIFKWLPQLVVDHKGNVQQFSYIPEDERGVTASVHERNRLNGNASYVNRYLKRVQYCNEVPWFVDNESCYEPDFPGSVNFLMGAVLDYGDHTTAYDPEPDRNWSCRTDAFSMYQSGFEIRTYRLCQRVLMFHHFPELAGKSLVRSLELAYRHDGALAGTLTEADYIVSATQTGHEYAAGDWQSKSLPAMTFEYEQLDWNTDLQTVAQQDFSGAPQGLTGPYQWIDFEGEGISGILSEQGTGWFYKNNLGDGHFAPPRTIAQKPSFMGIGNGSLQWKDLDADGRRQVVSDGQPKGYWELDDDQKWGPFRTFPKNLNIDWNSPFTKMIDLNGDGKADVLFTDDRVWTWWENQGTEGFDEGGQAPVFRDEEKGPVLLLRDSVQSIFLADMSGDGMTDLVRIRNGEVCYWPNLGYGKFGAKVTMSHAPTFHSPDLYHPEYLTLADISGTGAADLIYIGKRDCAVWINLSGNGFAEKKVITWLPSTDPYSKIAVLDFLGNGTGCIVWSSPLPQYATAPLRYIDLMGGKKPYLMKSYYNGMGKTVAVTYKSSTQFYLADKLDGISWATKLPFPVHCIHTLTTSDSVSETSYTQTYLYRHGYYDHEEREFRGFGYVETIDIDSAATSENTELDQAPVKTKTWYHTGAWMRKDTLLNQFKKEYFQFEGWDDVTTIADFPTGLSAQEQREAYRALKGLLLRQEVYAADDSPLTGIPYAVTASAYTVRKVQKLGKNRFASFFTHQQQSIVFHCERDVSDPRIVHDLTLETDDYGNVLQSAQVAYPRKHTDTDLPEKVQQEQAKMHITATQNTYTNDAINDNHYRLRLPYDGKAFELLGVSVPSGLWTVGSLVAEIGAASPIDFSATPSGSKEKRLLSHTRSLFKANTAIDAPLTFAALESLAIPHEQYQLAITTTLLGAACYGGKVTSAMLNDGIPSSNNDGGYVDLEGDGNYWLPSGCAHYLNGTYASPAQQFYTPVAFTDPWENTTIVGFGESTNSYSYWLLPISVTDAVGNTISVETYDWRTLQPRRLRDTNENYSEMVYDALGLPVAMAVLGKNNGSEGDSLSGINIYDPDDEDKQGLFFSDNPDDYSADLLGSATWRCIYDFTTIPVVVGMIARQHHVHNPVIVADQGTDRIVQLTYTDGMGRVIMNKMQCAGNSANGNKTWVGTGRTLYNNKGNVVMQYESYFSGTHYCDSVEQAENSGVAPKMLYDPLNRVKRTNFPDGCYSKVEWTAWKQTSWDNNDTVKVWNEDLTDFEYSDWYKARAVVNGITGALYSNLDERQSAVKALAHADTPTVMHTDTLARPFYTIQQDSTTHYIHSYVNFDIVGNRLSIVDGLRITGTPATDPLTIQYKYNMLKQVCYQESFDSGHSFSVTNVAGQPFYGWDTDNRKFRMDYDDLRRLTKKWLNDTILLEELIYGEGITAATVFNLNGQLYQIKDGAGTVTIPAYDFKGNPLSQVRVFATDATAHPDWSGSVSLETDSYVTQTVLDALNRPVQVISPEGATTTHIFERGGNLFGVRVDDVHTLDTDAVSLIWYDAKGQRKKVQYGNGTTTCYEYDPSTFRVTRIRTTRHSDSAELQDLRYCYDPVGNITLQKDLAQQPVYFDGSVADPENDYTYDALYRLIECSGREHAGTNNAPDYNDSSRDGIMPIPIASTDTAKMRRFTQYYEYDAVSNFARMRHTVVGGTGNWTRYYTTDAGSNRLESTVVGSGTAETYTYDSRGNMTGGFGHIGTMTYNDSNRLESVVLDSNRTAYFQYDSAGQRVRKTILNTAISTKEIRIYVGSWELYQTFNSIGITTLARETLHISDDMGRMALIDTRTTGSGTEPAQLLRYQYSNHLGTATIELDDLGGIISYEEYYPYGSTSFRSGRSTAEVSLKRYRYTEKERDEESGFYYHGARYYVSWIGRWSAVDPKENKYAPQSPYAYCSNNPVMKTDEDGEGDEFKTFVVQKKYQVGTAPTQESVLIPKGYEVATWAKTDDKGNAGLAFVIAIKAPDGTIYKWNEKSQWFTSDKGKDYSNPGILGLSMDIENWAQNTTKASIGTIAQDALQKGDPFATIKESYSNYKKEGGKYGVPGFIGSGVKESLTKTYEDVKAGGHRRTNALIGIWQFGSQVAKGSVFAGGKSPSGFLFRGTSEGFEGNSALLRAGVTPTSMNPAKATVFATASERYGKGVLQIASESDLKGVVRVAGNVIDKLEEEIPLDMVPSQFASRASITITSGQARDILKKMGINIPKTVNNSNLSSVLESLPQMTEAQIKTFVKRAQKLSR